MRAAPSVPAGTSEGRMRAAPSVPAGTSEGCMPAAPTWERSEKTVTPPDLMTALRVPAGTFAARWELPREAGWRVRTGEDGATESTGRCPLDILVGNRHSDGNPGSRYRYDGMAHRLKSVLPSLLLDALVVLGLAFPDACTYLRWPLLGLYALFSFALLRRL